MVFTFTHVWLCWYIVQHSWNANWSWNKTCVVYVRFYVKSEIFNLFFNFNSQLSELSSRLNDEEEKNRQLEEQISTLQITSASHDAAAAADNRLLTALGAAAATSAAGKHQEIDEDNNWSDDSDDEFEFPGK